jgi:NTP pyrophosphatase (non-canonical NTP hydrolase)
VDWNTYQDWVGTKVNTPVECSIVGLCGEAGETVDLLKKHLWHGKSLDTDKLKLELGDVLFYLADIARQYGILLHEVMQGNVDKIDARYPTGFTLERAALAEEQKRKVIEAEEAAAVARGRIIQ